MIWKYHGRIVGRSDETWGHNYQKWAKTAQVMEGGILPEPK